MYGYVLSRSGNPALAEDLTADTFMAAAAAVRSGTAPTPATGWLTGIARHKLADHWRRLGREQRALSRVHGTEVRDEDPWSARLDVIRAREVLAGLRPQHRAALTLRHADGLSVPEVAAHLGRTVHATEALLTRARAIFRARYEEGG